MLHIIIFYLIAVIAVTISLEALLHKEVVTMTAPAVTLVDPTCLAVDIAASQKVARYRRLVRWINGFVRALGVAAVCRLAILGLDTLGMLYIVHNQVPGVRAASLHVQPELMLLWSGNVAALKVGANALPFMTFLLFAWPRALLGDYYDYRIAVNGVQYLRDQRSASGVKVRQRRWTTWRMTQWTSAKRRTVSEWLKRLRGAPLLGAVFVLKLVSVPGVPITPPAAAVAGAARANPRWTAIVIVFAAGLKTCWLYAALRSW